MPDTVSLAVYDFDGTMIAGDSIASLVRYVYKKKRLTGQELLKVLLIALLYLLGVLDEREAKEKSLGFIRRMTPGEQDALFSGFARDVLLPAIYPKALNSMMRHREQGRKILVVSASPDLYMRHLAAELPVDAVLATPVGRDGSVGPNCKGEEKVRRINAWLDEQGLRADWATSFAYGDSAADSDFMQLAGNPVAVNPKRGLKAKMGSIPRKAWGN